MTEGGRRVLVIQTAPCWYKVIDQVDGVRLLSGKSRRAVRRRCIECGYRIVEVILLRV